MVDLSLVLSYPMSENDADAGTVDHYLCKLLWTLWQEGEWFSSKRPFGNSGWEYDLYKTLIAGGFVSGELDENGYIDVVDEESADEIIFNCIEFVFKNYVGE